MIGRQLDDGDEVEAGRLNCCGGFCRGHPYVGLRPTRLSEDGGFLSRAVVPIDNRQASAGFQGRRDDTCQARLLWDTMEGVRDQDEVNRPAYDVCQSVGVAFNELA